MEGGTIIQGITTMNTELDRLKLQVELLTPFKGAWDELFPGQSLGEAQATVETLREQLAQCQRQLSVLRVKYDQMVAVGHATGVAYDHQALAAHDSELVAPTIELLEHINNWFPCCAQLLDGWHNDAVWSDWDEEIRKKLTVIQSQVRLELARLRSTEGEK